jgi:hypothetical protein
MAPQPPILGEPEFGVEEVPVTYDSLRDTL